MINITLPDGSVRQFDKAVTIADIASSIGSGLAKAALAGRVDSRLVDTSYLVERDAAVAIVTDKDAEAQGAMVKKMASLLEAEDAAYDVAGYRDAPPGLRIWCGATVDTADIEALGPWLDWAWAQVSAA